MVRAGVDETAFTSGCCLGDLPIRFFFLPFLFFFPLRFTDTALSLESISFSAIDTRASVLLSGRAAWREEPVACSATAAGDQDDGGADVVLLVVVVDVVAVVVGAVLVVALAAKT